MPIYEFHCNTCGTHFEKILNFAQAIQKQECPRCHSLDTEKQILVPSLAHTPGSLLDTGGGCGGDERFT
jgi:putative FmdB family regulatory protein